MVAKSIKPFIPPLGEIPLGGGRMVPKIPFRVRLWLWLCKVRGRICLYVDRPIEIDPKDPLTSEVELTEFASFLGNVLRSYVEQKRLDKEVAKELFTRIMRWIFGDTYEDYIEEVLSEVE